MIFTAATNPGRAPGRLPKLVTGHAVEGAAGAGVQGQEQMRDGLRHHHLKYAAQTRNDPIFVSRPIDNPQGVIRSGFFGVRSGKLGVAPLVKHPLRSGKSEREPLWLWTLGACRVPST